jgi:phosphoribosylglycinamide formyltransferase-1
VPRFVSEDLRPEGGAFDPAAMARGEPSLPPAFAWRGERLVVATVLETWRTTKVDRGDTYLKRHYFAFATGDGRRAVVYFQRQARAGEARWRLYEIDEPRDGAGSQEPLEPQ